MTVDGFDLKGKRALVVGAETKLGRVIAEALAEGGARLMLGAAPALNDERIEIFTLPPQMNSVALPAGSAEAYVQAAVKHLGGLDVVVNAVDLRVAGPFEELSDLAWDRLLAANLTGPIRLFRAAGRQMKASGGGKLIQVVSMLGERGVPNTAAYGATQAGLLQLIRALALEWARSGIRVNGIGIGWLEGDPLLGQGQPPERLLRYLPTKRDTGSLRLSCSPSPSQWGGGWGVGVTSLTHVVMTAGG